MKPFETMPSRLKTAIALLVVAAFALPASAQIRGEEEAILTQAPNVPPPITRDYATKVIVHLEVREVVKRLADGVEYVFWTFGGDVPGSFIRIREGDLVVARNINPPSHTRIPRYVRGRRGRVAKIHGVHVFPYAHAATGGEVLGNQIQEQRRLADTRLSHNPRVP